MPWNVINVTPGFEQKIKNTIESSPSIRNINKKVLVPAIQRKGFISGKMHFYLEKLYPGYVFIECEHRDYDELFSYIANISYIMNMSSIKNIHKLSLPIDDVEMVEVLRQMGGEAQNKDSETIKNLKINDKVKITSGPFSNFEGIIKEVHAEKVGETKIKVATRLFNNDLTFIIVSEYQLESL